jgi:hypothetical protein
MISSDARVSISLEEYKSGEIIRLTLKEIGNLWI